MRRLRLALCGQGIMDYKYTLPTALVNKASKFEEFANGGAQATIVLNDGRIFSKALISNSTAIIAMRGYNALPFEVIEISDIYQTDEDKHPNERGNWEFWDEWP
jgi:hypothetical protein